jgi:hypothetical protein
VLHGVTDGNSKHQKSQFISNLPFHWMDLSILKPGGSLTNTAARRTAHHGCLRHLLAQGQVSLDISGNDRRCLLALTRLEYQQNTHKWWNMVGGAQKSPLDK